MNRLEQIKLTNRRLHWKRAGKIFLVLALMSIAIGALLLAFRQQVSYYYTPAMIPANYYETQTSFRLGGLVKEKSIKQIGDGAVEFNLCDDKACIEVVYIGLIPSLFAENSWAVAEGSLRSDGRFMASILLAKHDEIYEPG